MVSFLLWPGYMFLNFLESWRLILAHLFPTFLNLLAWFFLTTFV